MRLPGPLRAVVGLVATAADEARHLPDRAVELPMLAVSTALQASLRAQQRYARLAAKGDEVLNPRRVTDEPPAWATFDEPVPTDDLRRAALAQLEDLDDGGTTSRMFSDIFGVADPSAANEAAAEPAPAKRSPKPAARKQAAKGKSVSKPRHTAPSKFDDAADDD